MEHKSDPILDELSGEKNLGWSLNLNSMKAKGIKKAGGRERERMVKTEKGTLEKKDQRKKLLINRYS